MRKMFVVLSLMMFLTQKVYCVEMHFPSRRLVPQLCDAGPSPHIVDDTRPVAVQFPPVKYSFTGNSTLFTIDKDSGIITTLVPLEVSAGSKFVLQKEATDSRGHVAVVDIDLHLIPSQIRVKQCPKQQLLNVRETAVIGEEIGQLECGNYVPWLFEKHKTTINATGSYVPINITQAGVLVVSSPLQFTNSICDITLFNATVRHFTSNPGRDCTITQTKFEIRVRVEKADCPSNWTYLIQQNKMLAYPPILSLTSVTTGQCMETCTSLNSTPCNSLAYDLVRKSCDLYNETELTVPGLVERRLEILPKFSLRQLSQKISTSPVLTTSVSERLLLSLLSITGEINMTRPDRRLTADLLYTVVTNTTFHNSTRRKTSRYLKAACQLLDHLIENQTVGNMEAIGIQADLNQLILTFDTLMAALTSGLPPAQGNLEVQTNHTHVKTESGPTGNISQRVDLVASGNMSRVIFPDVYNDTTENEQILFVTGVVTIHGINKTTEMAVVQDKTIEGHMTLTGHMVSVNMRPYVKSMFVTPLQLDIFTQVSEESTDRVCVFLHMDTVGHQWHDTGCRRVAFNTTHVRCQCDHLTNFAVLMQVKPLKLAKVYGASLEVLTVIGCCISIVSLSTTVITLMWLRLQSDRYVLLMNLSVAIVLAQVVFLTGIDATRYKAVCRFVAILLHYLFLCVFTLMLAEGIFLYQKLYRAFTSNTSLTLFLVLGWGAPFILVAISLLTNAEGYGTDEHCWLSTDGAIWAFVGPALTIISINTGILVMILQTFLGIKINAKKTDTEKFKASVRVTVVLLPLLGLTWMFGLMAVNSSTVVFQYLFAVLNSLQGLFIFLFHVVFNKDVRALCGRHRTRVATVVYSVEPAPDRPLPQVKGHTLSPDNDPQVNKSGKRRPVSALQSGDRKQGVFYRKATPVTEVSDG